MSHDIVEKTRKTSELYFKGFKDEKPFDLWKSFDKNLAKNLSLFITGGMYSREKIPHTTRQLIAIACLTVLGHSDELKLHIHAALNVGCSPEEITEVIFQTFVYGGMPTTNQALHNFRAVLEERNMWPLPQSVKAPKKSTPDTSAEEAAQVSDATLPFPGGKPDEKRQTQKTEEFK